MLKTFPALAILAGSAAVAQMPAAATGNPALASIPGATIRYYPVSGRNVTEINRSIARQRPKGRDGRAIPATLDWEVKADFQRTNTGGACKVSGARASFAATADLPRLAEADRVEETVRNRWNNYVAQLEEGSLATLAFVHGQLGTIERAMMSSSCEKARAAGAAAIQRMRELTDQMDAERERRLKAQNASLSEFRPRPPAWRKITCRKLEATESRLRTFNICLPQREWERMNEEGEKFTREIQNQSINAKYF